MILDVAQNCATYERLRLITCYANGPRTDLCEASGAIVMIKVTWKSLVLELTCTRYHNGPRTDMCEVSGARVMINVTWNDLELELVCMCYDNGPVT